MSYFFLSHLETSRRIFAPLFSSPTVILYILYYPFPPSLMNPRSEIILLKLFLFHLAIEG